MVMRQLLHIESVVQHPIFVIRTPDHEADIVRQEAFSSSATRVGVDLSDGR